MSCFAQLEICFVLTQKFLLPNFNFCILSISNVLLHIIGKAILFNQELISRKFLQAKFICKRLALLAIKYCRHYHNQIVAIIAAGEKNNVSH